jgi:ribose transport system permease protein
VDARLAHEGRLTLLEPWLRNICFWVFSTSGLCASLVGLLLAGIAGQTYLGMGDAYLLIPIAAVVLGGASLSGGTGGYLGSPVGSIIVVILAI